MKIITGSEKCQLSTFDVVNVNEMSLENLLPFGSIFTLVAEEGRIFAAYVPQVVVQGLLVLVRPITLVTLEWHDRTNFWPCNQITQTLQI